MVQHWVYCVACGTRIALSVSGRGTGTRQRYCSNACRQRAYRQRLAARDGVPGADQSAPQAGAGSLPIRLDKFIGRATEMEFLAPLRDSRLLTLTGPPGSGKSRLTLHYVQQVLAESAAVGWVDLADSRGEVAAAVGRALGIAARDEMALADALGGQRTRLPAATPTTAATAR
jgi:hypothetical protein